jgi:hypothetical protein
MNTHSIVRAARALEARIQRHGMTSTAYDLAMRALNSGTAKVKVLKGVVVERPHPDFLECPRYTPMLLSEQAIRAAASDPVNEMSQRFVNEALARGDQCFAICDGDRLAAYGWYAFGPTPINLPDLLLHYRSGWVYMYKGFTHADYRGQRLHAIGMTLALQHYRSKGFKGIVSYVESTNFDSLKSCFRMGYTVFGAVYVMRALGRNFAWSSPGCERFDFRVQAPPTGAAPLTLGKT